MSYEDRYKEWKKKKEQGQYSASASSTKKINQTKSDTKSRYEEWKRKRSEAAQDEISTRVNSWLEKSKKLSNQQKTRYSNASTKYRNDSADWLQTATAERDALRSEAREIARLLADQKHIIGDDYFNSVANLIQQNRRYQSGVVKQAKQESDYWSQWENEEAYIRSSSATKGERQKRYQNNSKKLAELKEARKGAAADVGVGLFNASTTNPMSQSGDTLARYQRLKQIDKDIANLEADMRNYERGTEGYTSKVVDDYSRYISRADFAEMAANRNYTNPTREDLLNYDMSALQGSVALSSGGYYDDQGNIRDSKGNIAQSAAGPRVEDKLGMFLASSRDDITEAYNALSATNGDYTNTWAELMREGDQGSWNRLTEDEVGIYYYLLNSEGQEAANKYLDDMQTELNRRQTINESQQYLKAFEDADTLERLGMNLATVPAQMASGVTGLAENAYNLLTGNDINPYSAAHSGANYSNTVRGAQAAKFDENGLRIPVIDFTAGDFYQTGMSLLDSWASMGIGGKLGGVLLFTGSANSEAQKLYEQGASNTQVALGSAAAGAAELVWESVAIDSLFKLKDADSVRAVITNVLKQGGVEAIEEGATEITNILTNAIIMGSESDWNKLVEEYNGDSLQALIRKVQDVASASFGGFISGAVSSSAPSSVSYASNQAQFERNGNAIVNANGGVEALQKLANDLAAVSEEKVGDNLKRLSENASKNAKATGRLYSAVQSTIMEQSKNKTFAGEWNQRLEKFKQGVAQNSFAQTLPLSEGESSIEMEGNLTAEKNSEYDDSRGAREDGNTYLLSTGKAVEPGKITDIRDGKVTMETRDGQKVDASDVEFGDQGYDQVFRSITSAENMTAQAANSILEAYRRDENKIDPDTFSRSAEQAFRYGYYNISKDYIAKNSLLGDYLHPEQIDIIYGEGRRAALEKAQAAQAFAVKGSGVVSVGKVHFEGDAAVLTERQRTSLSALEKVAEATGLEFHIFESETNSDGQRLGANGWYDPNDNSIHIDLHAGANGEGTMLFTAAHELTHHIKKWSPEKFKTLSDFLMIEYGNQDVDVDALVAAQIEKAQSSGRELSYDAAFEEVVADSMETMLSDGKALEKLTKLKQQDRSLWQKVKDFISDLAAKIRSVYEGMTPDSAEGRLVAEMKDSVERLQDLFVEGLADASGHYQAAGAQKNTAGDGGVKYQARSAANSKYDYTKSFIEQLRDYKNGVFPESDTFLIGKTPDVLTKIGLAQLPLVMDRKHVSYALDGSYKKNSERANDHIMSEVDLAQVPNLIADPVAVIQSRQPWQKKASEYSVDVLIDMDINGKKALIPVNVNSRGYVNGTEIDANRLQTVHGNTETVQRLANALNEDSANNFSVYYINKEKAADFLRPTGNLISSTAQDLDGFIHSVTDNESRVKMRITSVTESQQFARWFGEWKNHPGAASKIVNSDGTPKIMYHGSPAQFTVFDKRKARSSGLYGKGFYFTDSSTHASTYGNQYAVYLNIRNPLERGRSNVTREQVRKFLETVAENEDYSIENYGTYDVDAILRNVMGGKGKMDAFQVLQDINATAIGDFVEAIELFNSVNGTSFDGIVVPTETVAFYPEQIKSATDNIGTFDGSNPDIRYQDRARESVSNRTLLVNALESAAQTQEERLKLQEYRKKIETVEDAQRRLDILNRKIREVSFAPGKRDTAKIAEMRKNAEGLADTINRIDKKLLGLEASDPLKAVLEREKKKAYKKAIDKGQKAAENYRENRKKAEMRGKIRRSIWKLEKLLNRGNKKRNIKDGLQDLTASVLKWADALMTDNLADEDILRNGFHTTLSDKEASLYENAKALMQEIEAREDAYDVYQKRQELKRAIGGLRDALNRERKAMLEVPVNEILDGVLNEYKKLETTDVDYLQGAYQQGLYEYISSLKESIGGTPVRTMTLAQLQEFAKVFASLSHTISNANRNFADNIRQSVVESGRTVIAEVNAAGGFKEMRPATADKTAAIRWNNLKPWYAFKKIGSQLLEKYYGNLQHGEEVAAKDWQGARDFFVEQQKKHGYSKWDFKKRTAFTSADGEAFELNLQQIMSLYAYSRREAAIEHLIKGGFVFSKDTDVVVTKRGIPMTYRHQGARKYRLDLNILEEITGVLTEDQKQFAENMQTYLSEVMGAKGNEVSMKLFGIKLFGEKFYFPLKSSVEYSERAKQDELQKEKGVVRIVSSGFTKSLTPHAKNAVVLGEFMDTWASHVEEMSKYHGLAVPLEDLRRVLGYRDFNAEGKQGPSVRSTINGAYTTAATKYLDQFIDDVNGNIMTDPRETLASTMLSSFKKSSVVRSASVVIQQPTAIYRAMAYINPKYFGFAPTIRGVGRAAVKKLADTAGIFGKGWTSEHDELYAELMDHAPIATIKEIGGFDTGSGKGVVEWLKATEYENNSDKVKALLNDKHYRSDRLANMLGGDFAQLADALTWLQIWEAAKKETAAKNPGLKVGSEEHLKAAGERFNEVVTKTQVYDSVFSRSANMRSKNVYMSMATSFMAEPTTVANMLDQAITDLRRAKKGSRQKNAGHACRTLASVAVSIAVNNLLRSVIYAARDDDEDETFLEKYLSSLVGGLMDDTNPLTYLPIARDLWSVLVGYDVERADISVVSDVVGSAGKWLELVFEDTETMSEEDVAEHNKKEMEAGWTVVDAISSMLGISFKNVRRDFMATLNALETLQQDATGRKSTYGSVMDAIEESFVQSLPEALRPDLPTRQEKLLNAAVHGDEVYRNRLESRYEDEDAVAAAMRAGIESQYVSGKIDAMTASKYLVLYGDQDGGEARWTLDEWNYIKEHGTKDGYSRFNDFYAAIDSGVGLEEVVKSYKDREVDTGTLSGQITNHYKDEYLDMSGAEKQAMGKKLVAAWIALGYTRTDAEKNLAAWDFESESGFNYQSRKELYLDGEITAAEVKEAAMTYGGLTEADANLYLAKLDFEKENGYAYDDIRKLYLDEELTADQVRNAVMTVGGKSQRQADKYLAELDFEKENGYSYENRKDAYISGEITAEELRNAMISFGGESEKTADAYVAACDWILEHPGSGLSISDVQSYTKEIKNYGRSIEDVGISPDLFVEIRAQIGKCEGTDSDGDGEADHNSIKNQKMAVIDSFDLTVEQKDALYFYNNWAKSKLRQAPWH